MYIMKFVGTLKDPHLYWSFMTPDRGGWWMSPLFMKPTWLRSEGRLKRFKIASYPMRQPNWDAESVDVDPTQRRWIGSDVDDDEDFIKECTRALTDNE